MPLSRPDNANAGPARRRHVPVWVWALPVFLLGMAVTVWVAEAEKRRGQSDQRRAFVQETRGIADGIQAQLARCEMLIRSLQSIFQASDNVTAAEYGRAFDNMYDHGGARISLQALAFAERRPAGGEHYITTLVAPVQGNESIYGLDVATQPTSMDALLRSAASNRVAMSSPFRLKQSGDGASSDDGFVLRLPIYAHGPVPRDEAARDAAIVGSLGASFRIADLIEATMPDNPAALAEVTVEDASGSASYPLYRRQFGVAGNTEPHVVALQFGGRTWNIVSYPLAGAAGESQQLAVLWAGTIISALMAALAWSLVSTRERAIALGTAMSSRFRASEDRFRQLNELLPTLVILFDRGAGTVTYANQVARRRLGIPESGAPLAGLVPVRALERLANLGPEEHIASEALMRSVNGDEFWASIVASQIELDGKRCWLMVASDISEQRRLTERLSYEASHDALTRLPNRQEFEARLQRMLGAADASLNALLFIDLDQFKLINDTSGHMAGDQLLVQLAMVMQEQLRDEDVLARLGGDEFGVLLDGVADREEAIRIAENLRLAVDGYIFVWDQRSYIISASIGGTVFHSRSATLKELLAQVDTACYAAKDAGRNRVHFYSDDDAASQIRRGEMDWVNRIRWALEESRLVLAYQELQSITPKEGDVRVELLLRLSDEEGRLVLPGAFLPAAERYGLMPRIDRWVIETALANFDRIHPAGAAMNLCSINLSAASLDDHDLIDFILGAIERHDVDPRRIMFEITETVAVRDLGRASRLISCLRAAGCRIALDDFGAGMSSFGYLKNLGIDTIKIDGAFVLDIEQDAVSHSIVRAITEIGHQHGLDVVAEWVGNAAQVQVLAGLGVDYVQGFGIHRPQLAQLERTPG